MGKVLHAILAKSKEVTNLPDMRANKNPKVVAIVCSDMHLSHSPPGGLVIKDRAEWYCRMVDMLEELRYIQQVLECPLLHAGDLFDRWDSPPELINFAMGHLPPMYSIVGQHDLPNHSYDSLHRSAYWTVMGRCKEEVYHLPKDWTGKFKIHKLKESGHVKVIPVNWGCSAFDNAAKEPGILNLTLMHRYCQGLKLEQKDIPEYRSIEEEMRKCYKYTDTLITGDNHNTFNYKVVLKDKLVCHGFNPGSLMIRTRAQKKHRPCVGLVHPDGTVSRYYLRSQQVVEFTQEPEQGVDPVWLDEEAFEKLREEIGEDPRERMIDVRDIMECCLANIKANNATEDLVRKLLTRGEIDVE